MFNLQLRKPLKSLCLGLILLLALPAAASADEKAKEVIIDSGQVVREPGFYSGETVQIDGTIDGTTFAAGREVKVNGIIQGDLFAAAQEIVINGKITGNLFCAAQNIRFNGQVSGDVFGAGQNLEVTKGAVAERDMFLAGQKIAHAGLIQRKLFASGQKIDLAGAVHNDAKINVESLDIQETAVIKGNLTYHSPTKASISEKAQVNGRIDWDKVTPQAERAKQTKRNKNEVIDLLTGLAGTLLIWFIIALWRPQFWADTTKTISDQPLKTFGIGALVLILTPIAAIILMITLIGIPLGIILGIIYGISIYLAKIIVAVFIGQLLAKKFGWRELHKGFWLVLLGLAVIALLTRLPVAGFLLKLLVIFAGLGSLVLAYYKPAVKTEF